MEGKERPDISSVISARIRREQCARLRRGPTRTLIMVCLLVPALTAVVFGQSGYEDEGYDDISRRGLEQIDRLNEFLHQLGRVFLWLGIALLAIIGLKIISPFQVYNSTRERLLKRAVRDVEDLLKRIQEEVAAASAEPKEEAGDEGLLAGMTEIAEFSKAEQVPSYVLTVNDLMLDNIARTLKRLRRFREGSAERYRDYMFEVIKGIKTLSEESAEAGAPSGLAVDVREYFEDGRRYKIWRKVLNRAARKGNHRDLAGAFLLFMRNLHEGRPLTTDRRAANSMEDTAISVVRQTPEIPDVLSEETLLAIQEAAAREAGNMIHLIQGGKQLDESCAWQFELVRRQQQIHRRDEAQRMFTVFLSSERKALEEITGIRMLPCRTWAHILHMLGVENGPQLHQRVDDRLLTIQELLVLEKAFLQTFARRESLKHVYGHGEGVELMIDVHIPEIRRESLSLLRQSHQTEPKRLDSATETLNEEETPLNSGVKRLIEHYVHHGHDPPDTGKNRGSSPGELHRK